MDGEKNAMSKSLQTYEQLVPGANLAAYVQAVSSIPMLSQEREQELGEALFYHDDVDAARELVMAHLRFVVHIARSYSGYGLAEADLIQEGNVGLMKAVKRFSRAATGNPGPVSATIIRTDPLVLSAEIDNRRTIASSSLASMA